MSNTKHTVHSCFKVIGFEFACDIFRARFCLQLNIFKRYSPRCNSEIDLKLEVYFVLFHSFPLTFRSMPPCLNLLPTPM